MFHDPAYPSTERLNDAQRADIVRFNAEIVAGDFGRETVPCLCGGTSFDLISAFDRYRVRQPVVICVRCGLVQCQPRMTQGSLAAFYGSDRYRFLFEHSAMKLVDRANFEVMAKAAKRRRDFVAGAVDYARVVTVAEIGCGAGWNLESFRLDGRRVVGCDLSPMLTEAGRKLGLDLRQGGVETLAGETFDVIILSHVVEHFRDPVAEVGRAAALLNPGGALYIEVPDIGGLAFCLGALQLPHLYYFTPATLSHYLAPLGLKPVATGAIAGVSFHSVFVRDPNPPPVSLAGEYGRMRRTIRRFERREALKGWLRGLGLLSMARSLVRLAR